ncbi:MAG: signal recognition particle-docking protein FtsY [Haemophilus parahaemolyticus]|uniref:signal recognition particle-docking protein FtsY n=1 Tax=Haemophilus parahaemolyticus TaxID=735 RepID=UPI0026EF9336|nr:signal recognition particle-docking protein FtsY [Haemophilus parahaemolyticus]MBS6008415.1 signal recognition particle-docking protein FtsY [Haemophilus parahaemolyticus]
MSEKKKGFWSWLGFGKKENIEEQTQQGQAVELDSQNMEKNAPLVEEKQEREETPVEKYETVSEFIEQKLDEAKHFVEEKLDVAEHIIDELEEKIEQSFEEEKEESVAIVDTAHHKIRKEPQAVEISEKIAEPIAEEVVESVEEACETVENIEEAEDVKEEIQDEYQEKPTNKTGFFSRLIQGLIKTKQNIGSGFLNFFRGKKIDDDLFEELEEQLLIADLGMPTTTKIINSLTQHATKQQLKDAELLYQQLKLELADVLKPVAQPLEIDTTKKPYVILMVGVNGVGKTTTIGKLAKKFQEEGKSVMLAAGDTFRAAAVEQLQVWGERNHIPVIAQSSGSDSASVIFDAMQSASARNIDVLIADTAGRLQNKNHLMDELKKIVRVIKKYDETAPHEIMLTLDASTGQNAISQAKLFNEAVGLTGITLTKLDGTAKGGVIFAIADQFNIPIRFIGVGEKIDDLRPFNSEEFIEALFSHEEEK